MTPAPILGAEIWRVVTRRAGDRCECRGQCGQRHTKGKGRCLQMNHPDRPLHALPRRAGVPWREAVALAASQLLALCPDCRARIDRRRRAEGDRQRAEAYAPEALF